MKATNEGRAINSSETSQASGEIGGKSAEVRRSPEDVRSEMAEADQSAKSFTDMYREYFKKAVAKEESTKTEMEKLRGMKERGNLNLTAEDLVQMEKDGMEEAATLKRIAEGYRGDARDADRKLTKLEDELRDLGSADRPN